MTKRLVLFAAVVVALVALTASEGEASGQLQCERELQEHSLKTCRQVVDQQLRDVSPECQPVVVGPVARQYEQQVVVPPKGGSFYPGETTPPQQLQQSILWGIPALLRSQDNGNNRDKGNQGTTQLLRSSQ
uniref:High-molecular-weight glutenin subunit n=1 Tax=Triticum urartu TaxID=4572 RepID=A0A8R7K2H0_TRIUA